ncbi:MAG: molybdopterin-dependent oxidoreductase [Thermoleophilia bacterium]
MKLLKVHAIVFSVLVLAGLGAGCGGATVQLDGVEIRDYQGKPLDSVAADFRENSIKGPQYVDRDSYRLQIDGLVSQPQSLTYDQVLDRQHYSKVAQLNCVEGWSANILWEGVLVRDLLAQAAVKPEANTVIFWAYDGYSSSYPMSFFYDKDIIMASKMNDVMIPAERGFPFMLVAEDKWGYKWVMWITRIEVTTDPSFRGYWEQRGYNQNGDLTGSKYSQGGS